MLNLQSLTEHVVKLTFLLFQKLIPECWSIINGQDIVTRCAKYVVSIAYVRPGHRVLINSQGHLICRPSPLEIDINLRPCYYSVTSHKLSSYQESLKNVINTFLEKEWGEEYRPAIKELLEAHPQLKVRQMFKKRGHQRMISLACRLSWVMYR